MTTTYCRVIPRDLFNESKLLKCYGQLSLLIHEGKGIRWPLRLVQDEEGEPFEIAQNPADGGLFVADLRLWCGDTEIPVQTAYNSKRPYPLWFNLFDQSNEVFTDTGELSPEFAAFLDSL